MLLLSLRVPGCCARARSGARSCGSSVRAHWCAARVTSERSQEVSVALNRNHRSQDSVETLRKHARARARGVCVCVCVCVCVMCLIRADLDDSYYKVHCYKGEAFGHVEVM